MSRQHKLCLVFHSSIAVLGGLIPAMMVWEYYATPRYLQLANGDLFESPMREMYWSWISPTIYWNIAAWVVYVALIYHCVWKRRPLLRIRLLGGVLTIQAPNEETPERRA